MENVEYQSCVLDCWESYQNIRGPMIGRWLHRGVAALALILVVSGSAMFLRGHRLGHQRCVHEAGAAVPQFAGEAKLVIPTPSCSAAYPNCHWMLFMNFPLLPGQPRVGYVTGTHGVLVLPFPKFCGVIQVDTLRGPLSNSSTWEYKTGMREKIHTCGDPTTTTTTTTRPHSTTTTTTKPRSTTTTTAAPKVAATASSNPPTAALPFTDATSTPSTQPAAAQLPYTGIDFKPLAILGSTLVILGGLMLSTVESRRRTLGRATAIKLDDVKGGARRTSSWFLGE